MSLCAEQLWRLSAKDMEEVGVRDVPDNESFRVTSQSSAVLHFLATANTMSTPSMLHYGGHQPMAPGALTHMNVDDRLKIC